MGACRKDASLHDGVQCDAVGCIGRLADGRLVSLALSVEAFAEDCARAAVVVSPREAPGDCAAIADRPQGLARQWRGGAALDRRSVSRSAPRGRPATSGRGRGRPVNVSETVSAPRRLAAPDATPRLDDLKAGD